MEPKIEDIQAHYELISEIVGKQSFVNWQAFTKSTAELNNQIEKLSKELATFKETQQRRFITKMKQLKAIDIPDLIKTVKAKKLPKQALRAILQHFAKTEQNSLKLKIQPGQLKQSGSQLEQEYISSNKLLSVKMEEVRVLVQQANKQNGLLQASIIQHQPVLNVKFTFEAQKLQQIRKNIQIQQIPSTDHLINLQTYSSIVGNTFTIVKDEYKQLTLSYRKKQRQLIEQPQKYIETLIEYLTNTENLILQGQRAVVKYLGLTTEKVSQSQNHMIDKGLAQSLLFVQTGLRTRIKQSLQSTVQVDLSTTKALIQYQFTMINQKHQFFKQILGYLEKTPQNFQIVPVVIALTLNDYAYFKFELEEEDFMKTINDQLLLSNPYIAGLFKQMETRILFLMKDANVITGEMLKVMLYQSEQIQSQLNEMGLGKGTGGIFPGSTAQDFLKEQQKAQLQKMKKK